MRDSSWISDINNFVIPAFLHLPVDARRHPRVEGLLTAPNDGGPTSTPGGPLVVLVVLDGYSAVEIVQPRKTQRGKFAVVTST